MDIFRYSDKWVPQWIEWIEDDIEDDGCGRIEYRGENLAD
jgi:hypothetical protein